MNPLEEKEFQRLKEATEAVRKAATREHYSNIRTEREKATFAMMMRMNPDALTAIRKEFFVREDEIVLEEFIFIIQTHLNKSSDFEGEEQREFGMKMYELFQDIDVNGDGNLEWQEFTSFVVEKANILNKRLKSTSIPHYYDNSDALDSSALNRHRHDISKFAKIPNLCQFAMVEDHKNAIYVFNSRAMKQIATIQTESAPVALEYVSDRDLLVASSADMTVSTYSMSDPNHNRRYRQKSSWSTPGVQMALAYMPANQLLYSGGTNGNLYSWDIQDRSLVSTFVGHTDIVMALTVLKKLNNIASGSLDKTVNVWDSYTNARVLELQGHKKGVLDMAYSPEYRLLFSCGFEHDACVWSPFVNSLVYRFRGHHASLIGIQAVEDTPEVITADISGIFKLWDIRNYQCVQTFMANLTGSDTKDSSKLSCFFQTRLPPTNSHQREDDSRIFAASKMLFCFDQARVVHDATTDFAMVSWVGWNEKTSTFVSISDRTVIVWDALIGTKTVTSTGIVSNDITACCFDDRKRKLIIGTAAGDIGVYNFTNGALMKSVQDHVRAAVVGLQYIDATRRFVGAYANGVMRVYDENSLEECNIIHTFDPIKVRISHGVHAAKDTEIIGISFCALDNTVARVDACSGVATLWDVIACKCEIELRVCDSTECVVAVSFLNPYPLVATSDSRGNVCIWGSRGCKWSGKRIAGFTNHNTATAVVERTAANNNLHDEDKKPTRILADAADLSNFVVSGHGSHTDLDDSADAFVIDYAGVVGDDDDHSVGGATILSEALGANSHHNSSTPDMTARTMHQQLHAVSSDPYDHSARSLQNKNPYNDSPTTSHHNSHHHHHENSKASSTNDAEAADLALAADHVGAIVKQWGSVMAASCMCLNADAYRFFTADDLGYLRCYNISNMMGDVGGKGLLDGPTAPYHLKSRCLKRHRDHKSAPPPLYVRHRNFLVGHKMQSMSYLGIDFCWNVQAHKDRIVFLSSMQHGIISSGADRLVKLWSVAGELLGVLLQSVPVGVVNRDWHLQIDAEKLMADEEVLLEELLVNVKTLAESEDLPDIEKADLTGIEVGSDTAEFSRSELRQRVDLSSEILGIDFQTFEKELAHKKNILDMKSVNDEGEENAGDDDTSIVSANASVLSSLSTPQFSVGGNKMHGGMSPAASKTPSKCGTRTNSIASESVASRSSLYNLLGSNSSIPISKPLDAALKELKSAHASMDYDLRAAQLTHLQKRRRAAKMQQLADKYAIQAGMSIDVSNLAAYKTGLPAEPIKHDPHAAMAAVAFEPSSSSNTSATVSKSNSVQGTARSVDGPSSINNHMQSNSTVSSMSSLTTATGATAGSGPRSGYGNAVNTKSPLKSAGTLIVGGGASSIVSPLASARSNSSMLTPPKSIQLQLQQSSSSSSTSSRKPAKQAASGPRASTMAQRCSQYSSFDALEKVLETMSSSRDKEYVPSQDALHNENILLEAKRIKEMHNRLIEGHTKLPLQNKQTNTMLKMRIPASQKNSFDDQDRDSSRSLPLESGGRTDEFESGRSTRVVSNSNAAELDDSISSSFSQVIKDNDEISVNST